MIFLIAALGFLALGIVLAFHNIADGDLWAKLALGAFVWNRGEVLRHDVFAFTAVLPDYIDHEWGSGVVFYGLLRLLNSPGLMLLKVLLAFGLVAATLGYARRAGCAWSTLALLALPGAACVLPGYIPVIRCHAFTYFFLAVTLVCLEAIREGRTWPAFVVVAVMLAWANLHGGFVAGLGTVGVYTLAALVFRRRARIMLLTATACVAVTFINPYGLKFWEYLIPAVLHRRPRIAEWQPLPIFAADAFLWFRILFALTVIVLIAGWRRVARKSWPGLALLAITALLAWRSRRHAPFFGVAALMFAGPYLQGTLAVLAQWLPRRLHQSIFPVAAIAALYVALAVFVAVRFLPQASLQVLAPVGHDPVREVDILMHAEAKGNLAVPFGWGSYAAWRLYPRIQISMDGRYEAAYPEATFQLNNDFFEKRGPDWDRLLRDYRVDYVILDLEHERLRPEDLRDRGYELIWLQQGTSALLAREAHAAALRRVASQLPPYTIDPLDARIPHDWWPAEK